MHRNRNPYNLFLMVHMASGIDCGRMGPVTMTFHNMVAIIQLIHAVVQSWFTAYIFDIGHPCYGQLTPVKMGYPLTSIR